MPPLTERESAEEHLRVIRALMERATAYTAVSAPSALVAGTLALAASAATLILGPLRPGTTIAVWLCVLAAAAAANTWFLWKDAERRGDRFASSGMRAGLIALSPAWITGGVMTFCSIYFGRPGIDVLVPLWIVLYALGLLATSSFAPRSIVLLGWAFLAAGLISMLFAATQPSGPEAASRIAAIEMGTTFGGLHLVYGFITRRWREERESPSGSTA